MFGEHHKESLRNERTPLSRYSTAELGQELESRGAEAFPVKEGETYIISTGKGEDHNSTGYRDGPARILVVE